VFTRLLLTGENTPSLEAAIDAKGAAKPFDFQAY